MECYRRITSYSFCQLSAKNEIEEIFKTWNDFHWIDKMVTYCTTKMVEITFRSMINMICTRFSEKWEFLTRYFRYLKLVVGVLSALWTCWRLFTLSQTNNTRGHDMKLFKKRLNKGLNLRKYFFTQRVVGNWNRLPAKVVNVKTTNQFKNSFDKYLNENGYGLLKGISLQY